MSVRQGFGWAGFALVGLFVAAVVVWRGDVLQAGLDPQVPFQTYSPPPAPDYGRMDSWLLADARLPTSGPAAVFFVTPTAFDGGRHWNAPIDDAATDRFLKRVVVPNHVAPFAVAGPVSAPRYRQAGLYSRLTMRSDARDARAFAYGDVERAFDRWSAAHPDGPIVLAGMEQGAELLDRLLRERIGPDPALRRRLVAAYLIDAVVARERLGVPACEAAADTGCVIGWSQVGVGDDGAARRRLGRALVWNDAGRLVALGDGAVLCVNPVTGRGDGHASPARDHAGAANATGLEWGARPPLMDRRVAAQCRDGLLRITQPDSESFRQRGGWAERRKARPFNLFYADIEADLRRRLAAYFR